MLITILLSSCQLNDQEQAIIRYAEYTIDEIEFMIHNIYAKRLEIDKKESLELAIKVRELLKGFPDIKKCISLIKEGKESGLYTKELKLNSKKEEKLSQQILDAENMTNEYKQLKEVRLLINKLLYIRGLRLDVPRLVLKYSDTLELEPNQKYKFPIEIIYKRVGGALYKNTENIKEIEIITGEATDSIEEKIIGINLQNQLSGEVGVLKKKVYLKIR